MEERDGETVIVMPRISNQSPEVETRSTKVDHQCYLEARGFQIVDGLRFVFGGPTPGGFQLQHDAVFYNDVGVVGTDNMAFVPYDQGFLAFITESDFFE